MAADDKGGGTENGPKIVDIRRARRRRAREERPRTRPRRRASVRPRRGAAGPERTHALYYVGVGLKWLVIGLIVLAIAQWAFSYVPGLLPGLKETG